MDVNKKTPKEVVSDMNIDFLIGCAKKPGLHYFCVPTGGGKSYSTVQYVCTRGFKEYDRCIIMIPQTKLTAQMRADFSSVIAAHKKYGDCLAEDDIVVVENNQEVMRAAFEGADGQRPIDRLFEQMKIYAGGRSHKASGAKKPGKEESVSRDYLKTDIERVRRARDDYGRHLDKERRVKEAGGKLGPGSVRLAELEREGEIAEGLLRSAIKGFFRSVRGGSPGIRYSRILKDFRSLQEVFPQVGLRRKKVMILTSMKFLYGIDPILEESVDITNIMNLPGRVMLFLDEADLIFEDMIDFFIRSALRFRPDGSFRRPLNGYDFFLRLHDMIRMTNLPARHGGIDLRKSLDEAVSKEEKIWSEHVGTAPFVSIRPQDLMNLEEYRRGTFFCGFGRSVSISPKGDRKKQYVCWRPGDDCFTVVHDERKAEIVKSEYGFTVAVPVHKFLAAAGMCTTAILHAFYEIVLKSLETNKKIYKKRLKDLAENGRTDDYYLGEPTLASEIHSLVKSFGDNNDMEDLELHLKRFMTTEKRLKFPAESGGTVEYHDRSVYTCGVQLYDEKVDLEDFKKRITLRCREVPLSPETLMTKIARTKRASVILSSATCLSQCVTRNFSEWYFSDTLAAAGLLHKPSGEYMREIREALDATYPAGREIKASLMRWFDAPLPGEKTSPLDDAKNGRIPEYYRHMFSPRAREAKLDEDWLDATIGHLSRKGVEDGKVNLELGRLFTFIEVYHTFMQRPDVHSMIYFRNRAAMEGDDNAQFNLLASLIDGSFGEIDGNPVNFFAKWLEGDKPAWGANGHLIMTNKEEKLLEEIGKKQKKYGADAKFMLVCAYNSFKAGANLQYPVHKDLTGYLVGDCWNTGDPKKDWDSIYLETPKNYMTVNDETEHDYEYDLHLIMTRFGRLRQEHKAFDDECKHWLHLAVADPRSFRMGDTNMGRGLKEDKLLWQDREIRQAIGRTDRTKYKNKTFLLFADRDIANIADVADEDLPAIPEYRELLKVCKEYIYSNPPASSLDKDLLYINKARESQGTVRYLLGVSLSCYPGLDEDGENTVPDEPDRFVLDTQERLAALRRFFVRHPTVSNEDLERNDSLYPDIRLHYGEWPRGEDGSVSCFVNSDDLICRPGGKGKRKLAVSDGSLRLDVMRKNGVIREYFEKNGIKLTIRGEGLVLHPPILASVVSGELGEAAVRAVMEWMISGTDSLYGLPEPAGYSVECLAGRDFEVCDMVVRRPDGTFLPVDAKNVNPEGGFVRSYRDRRVGDNREAKASRLGGVDTIVVNVVRLDTRSCDIREIDGLIDRNGDWVSENLLRLRELILGKNENMKR